MLCVQGHLRLKRELHRRGFRRHSIPSFTAMASSCRCPFLSNHPRPKPRISCSNAFFRKHECKAAVLESPAYKWQQLDMPKVLEGGRLFREQLRIRSHEVGPNQESTIVAISNALQVCLLGCQC
jgi:hypothetical protein